MILYVNGDSHAAAADAVYPANWAKDDMHYYWMGDLPHPENLAVSWGRLLADHMDYHYHCHALPGSSNDRIIRTTKEWINRWLDFKNEWLMIIQWSTWDRTEWSVEGHYYQVGASGPDILPLSEHDRYKQFVSNLDWVEHENRCHDAIWELHVLLKSHGIRHVFFNGDYAFSNVINKRDWCQNYIDPYDPKGTYSNWLKNQRFDTVRLGHFHYGKDAHLAWSKFLIEYIERNQI